MAVTGVGLNSFNGKFSNPLNTRQLQLNKSPALGFGQLTLSDQVVDVEKQVLQRYGNPATMEDLFPEATKAVALQNSLPAVEAVHVGRNTASQVPDYCLTPADAERLCPGVTEGLQAVEAVPVQPEVVDLQPGVPLPRVNLELLPEEIQPIARERQNSVKGLDFSNSTDRHDGLGKELEYRRAASQWLQLQKACPYTESSKLIPKIDGRIDARGVNDLEFIVESRENILGQKYPDITF